MPIADFRVHKRGYVIKKCRPCENAYQREFYANGGAKTRERKRVHMAKMRLADPERARLQQKKWRTENHAAATATVRAYFKRRFFYGRALKLKGPTRATTADVSRLWYVQRGCCALTGRRLDRTAQLDHIVPRAKGGLDDLSNLRWVCAAINYAKRDMDDADLIALCSDVMAWIGRCVAAQDAILAAEAQRQQVAA